MTFSFYPVYQMCFIISLKWLQKFILDPLLYAIFGWTTLYGYRSKGKLLKWMSKCKGAGSEKFEESAQLVRIIYRGYFCHKLGATLKNFFYSHVSYVHPDIVIRKRNVIILDVTSEQIVFTINPAHVDIFNFPKQSSVSMAQFKSTTHLILMPLWAFNKLMETQTLRQVQSKSDSTDNSGKCIMISTSGGCCSTFLAQILSKIPNTRIVFHPWVYLFAHQVYQSGQLNWTHYRILLKNMTYHFLLMKENPTNLIFNLPSLCTPVVEVLAELCPDIKHVYCTRIPKASIADIDKEFRSDEYTFFHAFEAKTFWSKSLGFPYDHDESEAIMQTKKWLLKEQNRYLDRPIVVYATLIYATSILSYLRNRDHYSVEAIFHEDLIQKPYECLLNLCSQLGLNYSNDEDILLPFNADVVQSLRNKEIEDFIITGEDYELTKDVFFMLKLPFDVEADRSRLQQILNRRKRKIGLSQSGSRGGRILNPQNILQVINEP